MIKSNQAAILKEETLYCQQCGSDQLHRSIFNSTPSCVGCGEREERLRAENDAKLAKERLTKAYSAFKAQLLAATGVSEEHLSLKNRQTGVLNESFRNYAEALDHNLRTGKSLLLYGNVGTGKTTAAVKIALKAFQQGFSVRYIKSYENLTDKSLRHCDLLIIDELHMAVRMFGDKAADEDRRALYLLIEQRRNANKSHIFIANYGKLGLMPILGEEIYDRIADKARTTSLDFKGKSFRSEEKA